MEVAEILGVSKKSVYNMCANGTFKCVRIGTRGRSGKPMEQRRRPRPEKHR
ncbi:MAG: helix-turn-helix domain-containing protein [Firmicutes bacterium]|nr:helix-turn-helix domain-containing protein [Bacillota bacterium]